MKLKPRVTKLLAMMTAAALFAAACSGNDAPVPGAAETNGGGTSPAETAPAPTSSAEPSPADAPAGESGEAYLVLSDDLNIPWSIEFDGDTVYMSERGGTIVKLDGDGKQTRQEVRLNKAVQHAGEGGLLGLLLSPDFDASGLAYAYHTYRESGETKNRIALLKLNEGAWEEQRALLEDIPGDLYHNGGRLAFGPDGMLYATTGDAQVPRLAQDKNSLAGKILRMTPDGEIPDDNPFPGSFVYSYGHRNPQGLAWTKDGAMYATEHGPSGRPGGHDEINTIRPGANYGWPDIIGDAEQAGMETPVYHTGDRAIAPSGAAFDDEGRLLVAALVGEALYRFDPATGEMEIAAEGDGRIRDVKVKDGYAYIITNNRDGRGNPVDNDDRLVRLKLG